MPEAEEAVPVLELVLAAAAREREQAQEVAAPALALAGAALVPVRALAQEAAPRPEIQRRTRPAHRMRRFRRAG